MHITTRLATATRTAAPAFVHEPRRCGGQGCKVQFLARSPESRLCSRCQRETDQAARAKEAAARDLVAAAEGRRDFQRLLEDRAFKAYLDGQKSGTRKGRQVVIVAGPTSITRYLTEAQLVAVEANERAASFAVARLATASAPSN